MMEWLFSSIDPSRAHLVTDAIAWHGRLMVAAWGFLFPIGILIARFLKTTPKQKWPEKLDSQVWWHSHWILQTCGAVLVLVAVWLIWSSSGDSFVAWVHRVIGWVLVSICALQLLAGWLRGSKGGPTEVDINGSVHGDHYDMTPRRLAFEYMHKSLGYFAILVAWATTFLGLWIANAPKWMFIVMISWFVVLVIVFVVLQKRGLALDTYQAIWGPDPDLPGNQRKPIGLGVRREQP
jgi:hypothetical protein